MLNTILESLPMAARVTTQILNYFGDKRVQQISQRDSGSFQVYLVDGMAEALIQDDGFVAIRELEAVG